MGKNASNNEKRPITVYQSYYFHMVPGTGIEPVRYCYRRILSPVRLPVPPPGHQNGDSLENRTPDPVIKSHVLYQLS